MKSFYSIKLYYNGGNTTSHIYLDLVNLCLTQMQYLHIIQKIFLASFLQINAAPYGFGKTLIHK